MDDIIEVNTYDMAIYGGPVLLESLLVDNIENRGKTIKLSDTFVAMYGIPELLQMYCIGSTLNGKTYDATFFRKDT